MNSIWLNSGKRGATENPLLRPREGSESRASEPPHRRGEGMVLVRPWCRAVRAAATRTKTIVGRGDGTSQLRQLGIAGRKTQPERGRRLRLGRPSRWPRRKREGSCGAERRWRGDQDQVDSRRENVCACSSAAGEYATSKFSNFSEKGKLTFCVASFFFCSSSPRVRRSISALKLNSGKYRRV